MQPAGRSVTFTPEPGPFTIAFDACPAGGTLTVIAVAGAPASATATPPTLDRPAARAAGGDLLVLSAGVRVRNAPTVTANYEVRVPSAVRRVQVRLPGCAGAATDTSFDRISGRTVTLPLAGRPIG